LEKRPVAHIPGKSARATSTSVMCLYQEVEAAHLRVIQSAVFGVFPHPLPCESRCHWPQPSLARWLLAGQKRSRTLFCARIGEAATNEHRVRAHHRALRCSMGTQAQSKSLGPLVPSLIERRGPSWAPSLLASTSPTSTRRRCPSRVSIPTGSLQATASTDEY